METSKQQTLPFGEEKSTCSRGDFRASHFQQPGNGKVQPITVTSGRKCCEQFGRFTPDGSWAKTFSELLVGTEDWFSNRCTLTWKLKGTKYRRLYFQLAASAPPTSDTEHGLLPTVQTQGLKVCEEGKTVFAPIGMLPTPRTTDVGRGAVKDVKFENGTYFRENKNGVRFGVNITDVIASGLLSTPTASDYRSSTLPPSQLNRHSGIIKEVMEKCPIGQTSQLNPLFVSDMMGFPIMWCDI